MMNLQTAIVIGNTDGIGLAISHLLLEKGYSVIGISKSQSSLSHSNYQHHILDVTNLEFKSLLQDILPKIQNLAVCIYCAGIGGEFKKDNLNFETKVLQVNLVSAAIATEAVVNEMMKRQIGHFIGLSSIADCAQGAGAPSYYASKAGISRYWESLALCLKSEEIFISNIRFGFVDTKMAKSPIRPMMITPKAAASFIFSIIQKPRIRATKPLAMGFLVWVLALPTRLRLLLQ